MTREKHMQIEKIKKAIDIYCRAEVCAGKIKIGVPLSEADKSFYISIKTMYPDITAEEMQEICKDKVNEMEHQITEIYRKDGTTDFTVVLTGVVKYDEDRSLVCKYTAKIDGYKYPWKFQQQAWMDEYYKNLISEFIAQGETELPDPSKLKCEFFVNDQLERLVSNP